MSHDLSCEQVRELAAELAIGIADGQDRDAALRHAATCPDCRNSIAELSRVVDDVLLLAPAHEPPPGFQARAVGRIAGTTPWVRRIGRALGVRRLPILAAAASVVLALVLGSAMTFLATANDRRVADSYRAVLAEGNGAFFTAARVRNQTETVGTVYGYQGTPSWLFVTVHLPPGSGSQRYQVQLTTRAGQQLPLGSAVFGGNRTTWGTGLPVDLTEVAQLRFQADGQSYLVADINASNPWSSG